MRPETQSADVDASYLGEVIWVLSGSPSPAHAAKYNRVLELGKKAPAWRDLSGIDGKKHSLADLAKKKVVVVVFTCNHCPVARAYEKRIVRFTRGFKKKGVALVAINVNNLPADRLERMKERAATRGFNFPYLYDPSQKIGRAYGAVVTPHFFVLDRERKIAYMGAFDDNQNEANAKKRWLAAAVDALLKGERPEVGETRQFGCAIQYEKR